MDTNFTKIQEIFEKYVSVPGTEIEFRLGKINTNMFDTNIGKDMFERITKGLNKYREWENVVRANTSVYYKNTTRITIDDDTEEITRVHKTPITKTNFKLAENILDMRLAVSTEIPIVGESSDEVMDAIRTKQRVSFIRKNLSIDCTVVSGDTVDMDSEDRFRYEIEFEIVDPKNVKTRDELYNIVQKVFDVLKLIEC